MSPTDAMLFENWLQERNADAFKILATRYAAMVYQTCRRILNNSTEAEDVTQECFVILAATRKPVGGYLAPWLHRVAYNRSIARLRAERRRKEREVRFASEQEAAHDMGWDEIGGYVDEAIAELPEKLRVPVVACFLDGKSHEAISQALGIPRSTVTHRVDKGVECLRKTLQSKGVAITGAAFAGFMKINAAAAIPSSVLANLGKLALSGAGHVALPVTVGVAPFAKTVLSVWTSKTLLAAAASLAIVLFAGWEVRTVAQKPDLPDTQPPVLNTPSTTNVASDLPSEDSATPTKGVFVPLIRKGLRIEEPSQDARPGTNAGGFMGVAQAGIQSLSDIPNKVSSAWTDFKRTVSGENARRGSCQTNLLQLSLAFKLFADASPEHCWPLLNPGAGHLMFANDNPGMKPVFPTYFEESRIHMEKFAAQYPGRNSPLRFGDTRILICPSDSLNAPLLLKKEGLSLLDDYSYFYLGYVVLGIEDLEAFADASRARIAAGLPFDTDLDTPRGKLYRLREGITRFLVTDLNNPAAASRMESEIPVLIESPSHHDPEGGNVLFMDGHVAYIRFFPNGEFPMNKESMDILKSLSAMKGAIPPA